MKPYVTDLATVLLKLSAAGDCITLDDATRGIFIMGAIGAGKTEGSGRALAISYLMHGLGMLILCAKPDEADRFRKLAFLAGREKDLRVIDAEGTWRFNVLEYERKVKGDSAAQLAAVLIDTADQIAAHDSGGRGRGGDGEAFWKGELIKLCENTIDTALMAGRKVDMVTLANIVRSAATSADEYNSEKWTGECAACLQEAAVNAIKDAETERDFDNLVAYWSTDYARLDERTRGPIRSSFTTMSRIFDRRPLRRLLASDTNISPDDIFDGRIVVVGVDPSRYGVDGRICNFVWKQAFQRAVLARKIDSNTRPVCLWVDEANVFLDEKDPDYQARCRSQKACTVYMGHSPSMFKKMIHGEKSDDAVAGFLGNLQTMILHQNGLPEAVRFCSDIFNKELVDEISTGTNSSNDFQDGGGSSTHSTRQDRDKVPPIAFTRLRTGGAANGYIVEAYVRKSTTPRFLQTGENWLKVAFRQEHFAPRGFFEPQKQAKRNSWGW